MHFKSPYSIASQIDWSARAWRPTSTRTEPARRGECPTSPCPTFVTRPRTYARCHKHISHTKRVLCPVVPNASVVKSTAPDHPTDSCTELNPPTGSNKPIAGCHRARPVFSQYTEIKTCAYVWLPG